MSLPIECDLLNSRFEDIDWSESVIGLDYKSLGCDVMRLRAWGLIFHLDSRLIPAPQKKARGTIGLMYLPDWSILTFNSVQQVQLQVRPYRPSFSEGGQFVENVVGLKKLENTWNVSDVHASAYCYELNCVLDHPFGYCILSIYAVGMVTLQFRPELLIPLEEYKISNDYSWWTKGRFHV